MRIKPERLVLALLMVIQSSPVVAVNATSDLCLAKGYTVGFFNGVRTSQVGGFNNLNELRALRGTTLNNEPVQYELFYNMTGPVTGATELQDFAEVFEQRAVEIDSTGELGKRWEYFWDSFHQDKTLFSKIIDVFPNAANLVTQLYTDVATKSAAGWSYLLSNPLTPGDYLSHNTKLQALAIQGQKLVLVAHSQGNLFMNHAYDHIERLVGANSVKAVHVAPASPTLRGPYVLASIDLVINTLRLQGLASVPANNITIPANLSLDVLGHGFDTTYLDPERAARARVVGMLDEAMNTVKTPPTIASVGSFTVTLTWDGTGDVDLHTFEPSGAHSYYGNPYGQVGYLDVDNTYANGPEHYFASCDPTVLQTGTYRVGINNYADATGRVATVQVSTSRDGTILTKSLDVGPERFRGGNDSPIPVFVVTVSKNASTGAFEFTAR